MFSCMTTCTKLAPFEHIYMNVQQAFALLHLQHANSSMSKCYRKHELDKKREYEERVREIEHGSFSPLVLSTAGGMGPIATTVYKRIASLIADKRQEPYSTTLFWLRCKLSFSLLRSAIMCLRGTRSFHSHSQHHSIALACAEAKVH